MLLFTGVLYGTYRRSLVDFSKTQRRASFAVRLTIFVLLTLSLSGLTILYATHQTKTVFLVDRSQSIDAAAAEKAEVFLAATQKANGGKITVVPFGGTGSAAHTNIEEALKYAEAQIPAGYVPHIILLSDGNETEGNVLAADFNPPIISTVVLPASSKPEVQLAEVKLPPAVQKGEPFYADVVVESTVDTEGIISLYRNEFKIAEERKKLKKGENIFRFKQVADEERQTEFTATLNSPLDTLAENNKASNILFTGGKPRVLILDPDTKTLRDFTAALREQGMTVITGSAKNNNAVADGLEEYDKYDAVILSNIPATAFSQTQMEALRTYVGELGGGLLMLGGEQSFGPGGYYKTPVEEILPVWCDYEKEKEKPSFALALVVDRSGSMGGQKMELAKEAAKAAVDLLTPKDFVAVVAFDNEAYPVSPIKSAASLVPVRSAISTIEAAGGTNIYPALNEAYNQLRRVSAKLKHIILLTDGYSMPGDADGTLRGIVADQITVSTVGVGEADNALLKKIAEKGKGRNYVCTDPQMIPQVFAKETLTASKSSMKEEPFVPMLVTPTEILTGIDIETAPPLLGFVETRAKPASMFILATESSQPLLLWRRFGLGMSAAFTSDVKAKWAAEWLTWDSYGTFWAQVIRRIARKSEGRNAVLNVEQKHGTVHITLDAVDDNENFIDGAEGVITLFNNGGKNSFPLVQTAPGRYETESALNGRETAFPASCTVSVLLQKDGAALVNQTRSIMRNYPEELRVKPANETLMKELAERTGGKFNPKPEDVFADVPHRSAWRVLPLSAYLLTAAAFLFILDVLLRRIDLSGYLFKP
ncbi:MAG: VWA domain-containing protein [Planctomycetaceae bacterium]|nr:VWA domain-containing protein [Planctomycetaceae bacterium]